ncbi:hypothetical protein FMEXI_829 [Fusarium mexicanum]|uniref:Uncharacterized protein n=1 Tax=Fusarium mexicanum TaxID=751941 RepID=A0A8H5JN33_9HYPO|nr:hypothetical protein FMEXI_829 [Fusarium mexicanum]
MSDEVDRASEHTHWQCIPCANAKKRNDNIMADQVCARCYADRQFGATAFDKDLKVIGQLVNPKEEVWAWCPERLVGSRQRRESDQDEGLEQPPLRQR